MSENIILPTEKSNESGRNEGDKMVVISDEVSRAKEVIEAEERQESEQIVVAEVPVSDGATDSNDTHSSSPVPDHHSQSPDSSLSDSQKPNLEASPVKGAPEEMVMEETKPESEGKAQETPVEKSDTDSSQNKICDVSEITKQDVNKDTSAAENESKTEIEPPKPEEAQTIMETSPKGSPLVTEPEKEISPNQDQIKSNQDVGIPAAQGGTTTLPPEKLVVDLPSVNNSTNNDNQRVEAEGEGQKSDTACAPSPTNTTPSQKQESSEDGKEKAEEKSPPESVYHVKWIQFKNQNIAIVTQNENGPCPLLAIMNCLLLQGRVKLPAMMEMVTSGQLMEYLGDCILENAPKDIGEAALLNYEQNMQDAMDVFHKLQTGLDVNVKFTGVSDFEYTRECIVFDLLNIPLYHGWLVDPESPEVVAAVASCSYNQLVEKIISQKNAKREELMTEALIAEEFLERTAAQLTYHGLSELSTTVKEDELCVFFRNNHFSTVYKHKKELFLLVTDQGFLTESNVVWETLCNVEGDGHFVDAQFRTFRKPEPSTAPIAVPEVPVGTDQQIDQDYLVALSLQQEQQVEQPTMPNTSQTWQPPPDGALEPTLSDHQLALRLQEEEDRRAALAANQRPAPTQHPQQRGPLQHQTSTASSSGGGGGNGSRKKDKTDCTIL